MINGYGSKLKGNLSTIGLEKKIFSPAIHGAEDRLGSVSGAHGLMTYPFSDNDPNRVFDLLSDQNSGVDLDMVEQVTGVSPELALAAYETGLFPMADSRDASSLSWIEPSERGVIKTSQFQVPKRLARTLKSESLQVTCNVAFDAVVESCGAERIGRHDTWINDQIRVLYGALHRMGFAHSIEVWDDCELIGGLYGVSLHGAFFGESMFSTRRDASKFALVHLAARLENSGMSLLDCQFYTRHLSQFGAIEIPEEAYLKLLDSTQDNGAWFKSYLSHDQLLAFISERKTR